MKNQAWTTYLAVLLTFNLVPTQNVWAQACSVVNPTKPFAAPGVDYGTEPGKFFGDPIGNPVIGPPGGGPGGGQPSACELCVPCPLGCAFPNPDGDIVVPGGGSDGGNCAIPLGGATGATGECSPDDMGEVIDDDICPIPGPGGESDPSTECADNNAEECSGQGVECRVPDTDCDGCPDSHDDDVDGDGIPNDQDPDTNTGGNDPKEGDSDGDGEPDDGEDNDGDGDFDDEGDVPPDQDDDSDGVPDTEDPDHPDSANPNGGLEQGPPGDSPEPGPFAPAVPPVNEYGAEPEPGKGADFEGDPVELYDGEFQLRVVDMVVPGRGMNFVFSRQYRSRVKSKGPLGYNWDHAYNARIFRGVLDRKDLENPHDDTFTVGAGPDIGWAVGNGQFHQFKANEDGVTFESPRGFFGMLRHEESGGYTVREPNGTLHHFCAMGTGQNIAFRTAVEDRRGNTMLFGYDDTQRLVSVIDTLERTYTLTYSTIHGRLSSLTDFAGRTVTYGYDQAGDLVWVSYPSTPYITAEGEEESGERIIQYGYSTALYTIQKDPKLRHNLVSSTDAKGQKFLAITYGTELNPDGSEPVDYDRVISQEFGDGSFEYTYEILTEPTADPEIAVRRTTFMDRKGFVEDRLYNSFGNLTERHEYTMGIRNGADPAEYVTYWTYDEEHRLLSKTQPNGATTAYTYQTDHPSRFAQGKANFVQRTPGSLGGDQDTLITTFVFEPFYQQVYARKDEGGAATSFIFDYQEGSPQENGMAELAENWGIQANSIALNLGDLNGDGVANTIGGNVVYTTHQSTMGYAADGSKTTQSGVVTTHHYNQAGQRIRMVDAEGIATQFVYGDDPTTHDFGYRIGVVRDVGGLGLTRTTIRDQWGNMTALIDERGIRSEYEYDALNRLSRFTRAMDVPAGEANLESLGYVSMFDYDLNGNLVREEVENRESASAENNPWYSTTHTYDVIGRRTSTSREVDMETTAVTQYGYDPNDNRTSIQWPEGNVDEFAFDERDLLWETTRGASDPALASTSRRFYTANGLLSRLEDSEDTDGVGGVEFSTYHWDGYGRKIRVVDAVGGEVLMTYNARGQVITATTQGRVGGQTPTSVDASSNVTLMNISFEYDELGRKIRQSADHFVTTQGGSSPAVWSGGKAEYTWVYDRVGRVVQTIDPSGEVANTEFDGASRPIRTLMPDGSQVEREFDETGLLISEIATDAEGDDGSALVVRSHWYRDALGRPYATRDSMGYERRMGYNSRGFMTWSTDANGALKADGGNEDGNARSQEFDGLGRKVVTELYLTADGLGGSVVDTQQGGGDGIVTTRNQYDLNGRLVVVTDDNLSSTTYTYDALNRRTSTTYADGNTVSVAYDRDSNMRQVTDQNGSTKVFLRDALNRVSAINVHRGPGVEGTTVQLFQYDGLGRPTVSYDNNQPMDPTDDVALRLGYDSLGNITSDGSLLFGLGQFWLDSKAQYDGRSALRQLTYPYEVKQLTYENDAYGRPENIFDGNQEIARYTYLGPHLMASRTTADGVVTRYAFDAARRPVSMTAGRDSDDDVLGYSYTWDRELDIKTIARSHEDTTDVYDYDSANRLIEHDREAVESSWTLDGVGNWSSAVIDGQPAFTNQWSETNEYTSFKGVSLENDKRGSTIQDDQFNYVYDAMNRLVRVTDLDDEDIARYAYDNQGRRTLRRLYKNGVLDRSVFYIYRSEDVLAQLESSGTALALTALYAHGPRKDEVISMERDLTPFDGVFGFARFYLHGDHQGSVAAVTNASGHVVERYRYSPYGRTTVTNANGTPMASSIVQNPYLYTGQRLDIETGNYYFRARHYSPERGRFLQRDAVGYGAGSMGLHEYVGSNPIMRNDPQGKWLHILGGAVVGALFDGGIEAAKQLGTGDFSLGKLVAAGTKGGLKGAATAAVGPSGAVAAEAAWQSVEVAFTDKTFGEGIVDVVVEGAGALVGAGGLRGFGDATEAALKRTKGSLADANALSAGGQLLGTALEVVEQGSKKIASTQTKPWELVSVVDGLKKDWGLALDEAIHGSNEGSAEPTPAAPMTPGGVLAPSTPTTESSGPTAPSTNGHGSEDGGQTPPAPQAGDPDFIGPLEFIGPMPAGDTSGDPAGDSLSSETSQGPKMP